MAFTAQAWEDGIAQYLLNENLIKKLLFIGGDYGCIKQWIQNAINDYASLSCFRTFEI